MLRIEDGNGPDGLHVLGHDSRTHLTDVLESEEVLFSRILGTDLVPGCTELSFGYGRLDRQLLWAGTC